MKSPVEQSFYQGIVDALDFDWIENTYLTIEHGSKVPSYAVQMELAGAAHKFIHSVMSEETQLRIQLELDDVLAKREMLREILIWVDHNARPHVIEGVRVVQGGSYSYLIQPILSRTATMQELTETIED